MSKGNRFEGVLESLATEKRELERQVTVLREDLELQRTSLAQLQEQRADAAKAVVSLSQRLATLEDQCTNLANFFVSVQRLYMADGRDDALGAIAEIVANLVGSEEVAVFETSRDGLALALSNGVQPPPPHAIPANVGLIGWVLRTGQILLPESRTLPAMPPPAPYELSLTACVPLLVRGRVTGAVAVFKMLPQKPRLSAFDHGIFEVLQNHGGLALYVATSLANGQGAS
jgi:GAF domain-containing protein